MRPSPFFCNRRFKTLFVLGVMANLGLFVVVQQMPQQQEQQQEQQRRRRNSNIMVDSNMEPGLRTTTSTLRQTRASGTGTPPTRNQDMQFVESILVQGIVTKDEGDEEDDDDDSEDTTSNKKQQEPRSPVITLKPLSAQAKRAWCPDAVCDVTALCHPCRRRYLVILATGRSGSTTLQEMLHSLPGVRLSGENNGMLNNFGSALDATRQRQEWKKGALLRQPTAWRHNPVPDSAFACVVQQMVETMNPPKLDSSGQWLLAAAAADAPQQQPLRDRLYGSKHDDEDDQERLQQDEAEMILGFKSILFPPFNASWTPRQRTKRLRQAAQFLNETLPCAKFVLSLRSDVKSHAQSMQKAFFGNRRPQQPQQQASTIEQQQQESVQRNRDMQQLAQLLGNHHKVRVLDSTEWTQNITIVNDLVSNFLGFDPACHFQELFQLNTQKKYKAGNITSRPRLPPGCR
ncbi:hypothetical protein ACA910_018877 [Epithemia clementina (nom. ined.)]